MLRLTCVYVISSFSLRELSLHSHLLSPSLALSLPLALFVWDYYACRSSPLIALKENYTQFYLFPAQ